MPSIYLQNDFTLLTNSAAVIIDNKDRLQGIHFTILIESDIYTLGRYIFRELRLFIAR